MEAIENMLTRRSVRSYKDEAIPQDVVERIAEAGTWAPTAMGR